MRNVEPEIEEQGTFEQKALGVAGGTQPIEQPLQGVAGQDQIELLSPGLRLVEQPGTDGRTAIRACHTRLSR